MDSERWNRVQELFERALELPSDQRERLLLEEAPDDPGLRAEVLDLITSDQTPNSMFEGSAADLVSLDDMFSMEGKRVGPYLIERRVGEGGMGNVYLATRSDGQFEQDVALKIIRRGMDTEEIVQRFRAERSILARLEHPHIARLLDGGVTSEGLPYFTMEYVEGEPIDVYCDSRRLSIKERMRLFETVCQAVSYAQRNLVVHRDLKPSNILVTSDGTVKLLDFGIAKLIDERSPQALDQTRTGYRVMTPAYASPEQVTGGPITTASDVYSLGVVLYQLTTGKRPYDLSGIEAEEARRIITGSDPKRPSAVTAKKGSSEIKEIAARRKLRPEQLSRTLAGDIDTICLTALRVEPEQRYSSAEQLLTDIRRYLGGFPIHARPASPVYRVAKFVNRHKGSLTVAATVFLVIVGLVTYYTMRLSIERTRAQLEAQKAVQVADFLTSIFRQADPSMAGGEHLSAKELLDLGYRRIARELANQPEVQANMMDVMASAYSGLGLYDRAEELAVEGVTLTKTVYGTESVELAKTLTTYGGILCFQGKYETADSVLSQASEIFIRTGQAVSSSHGLCLYNRGWGAAISGKFELADSLYTEALLVFETNPEENDVNRAVVVNDLGLMYAEIGQLARAESLYNRSIEIHQLSGDRARSEHSTALYNFALLLDQTERRDSAKSVFEKVIAMDKQLYGDRHPNVAYVLNTLGSIHSEDGDYDDAERVLNEALEIRTEMLGPDHPSTAKTLKDLGLVFHRAGRFDEAERCYTRSLEIFRSSFGEMHREYSGVVGSLAWLEHDRGNFARAESLDTRSLEIKEHILPEKHPRVAISKLQLFRDLAAQGRYEEAIRVAQEGLAIARELYGEDHTLVTAYKANLGGIYDDMGEDSAAYELLSDALETNVRILPAYHPRIASALVSLGSYFLERGEIDKADTLFSRSHQIRDSLYSEDDRSLAYTLIGKGRILTARDRPQDAAPLLERALELRQYVYEDDHPLIADARSALGEALIGLGELKRAQGLLEQAVHTYGSRDAPVDWRYRRTITLLADLYDRANQPQKAKECRALLAIWR